MIKILDQNAIYFWVYVSDFTFESVVEVWC